MEIEYYQEIWNNNKKKTKGISKHYPYFRIQFYSVFPLFYMSGC